MTGDRGPYVEVNGSGVWVPRTVPYLEARRIAGEAAAFGDKLELLGFSRDCRCDEVCELANRCRVCGLDQAECECAAQDLEDWDVCYVPAWAFELVEQ
jgi:hypothetical protein